MEAPSPSAPLVRLRKALGRFRRRFVWDPYDVFVRPVPDEPRPAPPEGYAFRWGTPEDLVRCDPFHTELDERERAEGAQRLALGHRLVLGTCGDLVVFTMWVNPRNLNVPGLMKLRLAPTQWFIYKAYTSPEHRGRKLYEQGMRFTLAEMASEGLTELVGYAHIKKKISRKGLAALSFRSAGTLLLVDFPLFRHVFLSKQLRQHFPESVARSGAVKAHPSTAASS
jgi:hypothetical protein